MIYHIFMKRIVLIVFVIIIVFGISRLINLTALPVFADEAIYIRWAQLMRQDFTRYVFFPLQDGKPPLHMILLTQFLNINPLDPLISSRLMSVLFGLFSMYLLGYVTYLIFNSRRQALFSMILYVIVPYSFFYNRMGLIDPLTVTFALVSLVGLFRILTKNKV